LAGNAAAGNILAGHGSKQHTAPRNIHFQMFS
jgi:hypothetical protein